MVGPGRARKYFFRIETLYEIFTNLTELTNHYKKKSTDDPARGARVRTRAEAASFLLFVTFFFCCSRPFLFGFLVDITNSRAGARLLIAQRHKPDMDNI